MYSYRETKILLLAPRTVGCYYLSIVNDHRSELFPCLCIVKGSTCFTDLDKQGLPLGEIFAQTIIDVLSLHVPQALILQPYLDKGNKEKNWILTNVCSVECFYILRI